MSRPEGERPSIQEPEPMSEDMVERVARSIAREFVRLMERPYSGTAAENRLIFERCARRAIEAMREPTEVMLDAAAKTLKGMTFSDYPRKTDAAIYRAMVRAALAEHRPSPATTDETMPAEAEG